MKKETLVTAIVFLGVGFLAGFAFNAHRKSMRRQAPAALIAATASAGSLPADASAGSTASSDDANGSFAGQLPKGHPQLTDAEVVQFFKDASAHNPSDPAPRLKLADFLYDHRHFASAITWFHQALALDPGDADARTDMATCYFNLGHAQKAAGELQKALKVDPRHAPTLFNLVVVNMEGTHNFAAARAAYNRLSSVNPNYPDLPQLRQALESAMAAAGRRAPAPGQMASQAGGHPAAPKSRHTN